MVSWGSEQPAIAAFSFITFILVSIPTWWMVDAGNVGGLLYIWWTATLNLIQFIDMVIWKDTALNYAPGWCDFVVRYNHIGTMGLIVAGLVIARRTCLITHGFNTLQMWPDKRREMLTDLAIGLSIPAVQLILFWFMQGHRFDILGGIGCVEASPVSILYVTLYAIWPIIIGFVSAVYAIRTLTLFFLRRREITKLLAATDTNLSAARYYRLIVLCAGEVLCTIPLAIFILVVNVRDSYYPWRGFADLHSGFNRVDQYPTDLWLTSPSEQFYVEWQSWITIALGLYFFAIFGFSMEAMKHYEKVGRILLKLVGLPPDLLQRKKEVEISFASEQKRPRTRSTFLSTIFTSAGQQDVTITSVLPSYRSDATIHGIAEVHIVEMEQDDSAKVNSYPSKALEHSKVDYAVELDVTVEPKARE